MEKIISNPIHAYKMMKRFAVDWQLIEKDLQTDEWSEVEFMLKVSQFLEKKTLRKEKCFCLFYLAFEITVYIHFTALLFHFLEHKQTMGKFSRLLLIFLDKILIPP